MTALLSAIRAYLAGRTPRREWAVLSSPLEAC